MKMIGTATTVATLGAGTTSAQTTEDADTGDLVDQMTLEEKVSRTYAADRYIQGVERLDVPGIRNINGPAGASLAGFIEGAETMEFPH